MSKTTLLDSSSARMERAERMRGWRKNWYVQEYLRTDDLPLSLGTLNGLQHLKQWRCEWFNECDRWLCSTSSGRFDNAVHYGS